MCDYLRDRIEKCFRRGGSTASQQRQQPTSTSRIADGASLSGTVNVRIADSCTATNT